MLQILRAEILFLPFDGVSLANEQLMLHQIESLGDIAHPICILFAAEIINVPTNLLLELLTRLYLDRCVSALLHDTGYPRNGYLLMVINIDAARHIPLPDHTRSQMRLAVAFFGLLDHQVYDSLSEADDRPVFDYLGDVVPHFEQYDEQQYFGL